MAAKDNYTFIRVPKDPWAPSNSGKRFTLRQLQTAVRNPENKYLSHAIKELGLKSSGYVSNFVRHKITQYGLTQYTRHWKTPVTGASYIQHRWPLTDDKYEAPLTNRIVNRKLALDNTFMNPNTFVKMNDREPKQTEVDKQKLMHSARLFLEAIGEDPNRDGLKETPKRYANYMADIMGGKFINTAQYTKTFENDASYDGPVVVTKMPFYTVCEHHLAPFIGTWDFAYKPKDRILGLSKIVRIARKFQKQPQVQERLTQQIADEMFKLLKPEWVVVRMSAEHFCMSTRGVRTPGALTYTRKYLQEEAPKQYDPIANVFSRTLVTPPHDILPIPAGE